MAKTTDWVPTRLKSASDEKISSPIDPDNSSTIAIKHRLNLSGPTWLLVLLVPTVLFVIAIGYQTGMVQTLGYESKSKQGGGFTGTASGYSLGLKTMYFREGQEVFADYDVDIKTGSFLIRLYDYVEFMDPNKRFRHRVESDAKGQASFLIKESGFYRMVFEGSVLGNSPPGSGYDINYTVEWGMR